MTTIIKKYPLVAIVGRTNVGKSTLFNKLTGANSALVSQIAGTTRDRRYGDCLWLGKYFSLIDTAGLDIESEEQIDKEAVRHAKLAIKEADLVLFVTDGKTGILPADRVYAKLAKYSGKPAVMVVNKIDSLKLLSNAADFAALNFDDQVAVSSKNGSGIGDLLDIIHDKLGNKLVDAAEEINSDIKIAIVGKPNVGKSSLFNQLVKEEKAIVSPVPHTTRESQDFTIIKENKGREYRITFIDTAGIIKKGKIKSKLTESSIEQSMNSIKKCDLVFFLIDASEEITVQDKNISRAILDYGRSLIFIINKWDLVKDKTTKSDKEYTKYLYGHFPFLTWAPLVFTVAKSGSHVDRPLEVAIDIFERQIRPISDEEMIQFTKYALKKQPPTAGKGYQPPYIRSITQLKTQPLTFVVLADRTTSIHFSYLRYLQNLLREYFHYEGCGINLRLEEFLKKKKHQT